MSSGFITESEIIEAKRIRQEEWEKVRTADQPLDAPEEEYDSRSLFHRLEEQKQKKQAEYEETHKLKNMIRGLDDDEVGFLDLVERTKATAAKQISMEEKREMAEFRERVSMLNEEAEKERLAQQLARPMKKPITSNGNIKSKLQGLVVRKRKASDMDIKENGQTKEIKQETNTTTNVAYLPQKEMKQGAFTCIGILPGVGTYNDSTDSENSSDTDDGHPPKYQYDLCGRKKTEKKKDLDKDKK